MRASTFLESFEITADEGNASFPEGMFKTDAAFSTVIHTLGGKTFRHGLYRVLRGDQIEGARLVMQQAFPEFAEHIVPFGYDWLGRHFAVDTADCKDAGPHVLMLEIGAGEAMHIPATIEDFHNVELVEYADDALARRFFNEWRAVCPTDLKHSECAGYKVPLFLGGRDDLTNLEVIDLSVYTELCGQLRNKTRTLRAGQTIRTVSIGN